jgi:hypothetical protein
MTILLSFKLSQNLKYLILADSTYQSAKNFNQNGNNIFLTVED